MFSKVVLEGCYGIPGSHQHIGGCYVLLLLLLLLLVSRALLGDC